jgi:NAD(P)-dependent dehydrogenase (short-subunit alcohol dehydrogenase family)
LGNSPPSLPKRLRVADMRTSSAEGIMRDMKTNFIGTMNVTNAALPHMRMRCDGTIIFIGSRSAYRTQMVVSTFLLTSLLPCLTLEFVQGMGMHRASVDTCGLESTALISSFIFRIESSPPLCVTCPGCPLAHPADPYFRFQRTERRLPSSSNGSTSA